MFRCNHQAHLGRVDQAEQIVKDERRTFYDTRRAVVRYVEKRAICNLLLYTIIEDLLLFCSHREHSVKGKAILLWT